MSEYGKEQSKQEVEETTHQTAATDETNSQSNDSKVSEDSKTQKSKGIDYKAELENERKVRKKAEAKIVELKKQAKEEDNAERKDEYLERIERLEQSIEQKLSEVTRTVTERERSQAIRQVATNDDEIELITYHLDNSIKPTGDIEKDVRRAKMLANEKTLLENKELKQALQARNSMSTSPSSSGYPEKQEKKNVYTHVDQQFAKANKLNLK